MKVALPIIILLLIAGGVFYFNEHKTEVTTNSEDALNIEPTPKDLDGTFVFSPEESKVTWVGSKKVIKDYFDTGTIQIKSGMAVVNNGKVESGEITFDMTSISVVSTGKGDGETMLTKHLKSEDFFHAEMYPEAKYKVTGYNNSILEGELTLKGETHPLMIPVQVGMENGNLIIAGTATINRSTWNVKYGSEIFFKDLGDKVINDNFNLEFKIVAKP
ncbi:MAG: hypothetical protein QG551_55 [Patescibacteria group bacterium]|nr:hypothetical protein [Patescibacteria group bacterium]